MPNYDMSFKYLSTVSFTPTRNINRIILMFSLTNHLEITINGETKDLDNHIAIINQADIFVNQINPRTWLCSLFLYFISIVRMKISSNVILIDIYFNLAVL